MAQVATCMALKFLFNSPHAVLAKLASFHYIVSSDVKARMRRKRGPVFPIPRFHTWVSTCPDGRECAGLEPNL